MRAFAILAVAALAACSQGGDEAANNQANVKAGFREARIGSLGLDYETAKLAVTQVTVKLPPDDEREVRGMKLVAKEREPLIGEPRCPDQEAELCQAEAEGGLTLTMLNQPYAEFSAPIRRTRPATFAGREGVTWDGRFGGTTATYTLIPVEQQTLMVIRQAGGDGAPDAATLDAVIATLRFNQPPPGADKGR